MADGLHIHIQNQMMKFLGITLSGLGRARVGGRWQG
jgi:hypothetical protein